uniref:WRKY1 n=1 Tax=Anthurium andraeanum TaxID=226677 RepID=A0A1S6PDB3_ANTAD|nr:WRKY1 [Anthurium andraeanum]
MENVGAWDPSPLIGELTQGQELTRQLEALLDRPSPPEQWKSLVQSIQSALDKAISMAKSSSDSPAGTDSPRSVSGSPRSESSDRAALRDLERREMCKKRKTLPKWTSQVRVCSGAGLEGPPDDGFSWRKYGQKDILGAKYPRGYYRCTHRNAQGCQATKQVQRSDENPSVFDVTYRGNHTCAPRGSSSSPAPAKGQGGEHDSSANPFLLGFRSGLTVKTEGLDERDPAASPAFSFPSTPASRGKPEAHIFSSPSTPLDNPLVGGFSPAFISPTASGSSYFPVSPCQVGGGGGFGGRPHLLGLESDLTEIISTAASATSSPAVDLDFMLQAEFDPSFPFDASFFY